MTTITVSPLKTAVTAATRGFDAAVVAIKENGNRVTDELLASMQATFNALAALALGEDAE